MGRGRKTGRMMYAAADVNRRSGFPEEQFINALRSAGLAATENIIPLARTPEDEDYAIRSAEAINSSDDMNPSVGAGAAYGAPSGRTLQNQFDVKALGAAINPTAPKYGEEIIKIALNAYADVVKEAQQINSAMRYRYERTIDKNPETNPVIESVEKRLQRVHDMMEANPDSPETKKAIAAFVRTVGGGAYPMNDVRENYVSGLPRANGKLQTYRVDAANVRKFIDETFKYRQSIVANTVLNAEQRGDSAQQFVSRVLMVKLKQAQAVLDRAKYNSTIQQFVAGQMIRLAENEG